MAVTNAIQLMAAMINDAVGVLGRTIEIVSQPVLSRAGVLDITAISKADAILSGKGNPLAVRSNSSDSQHGAVIGNYIANIAKAKRIAFLSQNDAYGNGAQASIEAKLKRLNRACEKLAEEKFPFAQADFRVAMTNVQAAKPEPTVAINANEGLGMPATLRQARQSRLPGKLKSAVGTVAPSGFCPQGLSGLARPLAAIFRPRPAPPSTTRATRATFSMSTGQPPVPAVPPVPLPTDAAKASHDQILQAAAEWFMEFGCAATTIDAVAQRLGATKGRTCHHDRSKADLYFANC